VSTSGPVDREKSGAGKRNGYIGDEQGGTSNRNETGDEGYDPKIRQERRVHGLSEKVVERRRGRRKERFRHPGKRRK